MPAPQSLKNHTRFDPLFHFITLPLLVANLIIAISSTIRHWPYDPRIHIWWIVMSFVLMFIAGIARSSALKAQDRIIRLEERLRLVALLPASEHARIAALTTDQLIGLRFASDAEVGTLALKALAQNLDRKAIKQNIVNWRADTERV